MKARLTLKNLQEIIYENDSKIVDRLEDGSIHENRVYGHYRFGKAEMREIQFDGVYITYGDINLRTQTELRVEADFPIVELHFSFQGRYHSTFDDGHLSYTFHANQHNIIYAPNMYGHLEVSNKDDFKFFEVGLSMPLFQRLAHNDSTLLDQMLKQIERQQASMLGKHNLPITAAMHFVIQEIMTCQRTGYLKRLFLEAKIIELFMLQVEQFEAHDCDTFCSLKKSDTEKIYEAKYIIDQKLDEPHSLLELSREIGINDFKLKKGFKEIFGTTIFGYINDLKMKRAREVLLNHQLSIAEVATLTGYRNQTHFTAAFKKKFGQLPSALRQQKNRD